MGYTLISLHRLSAAPGLPVGQVVASLCWIATATLSYAAWQRRRGDDPFNLLAVGGLWLAIRIGLLGVGRPTPGRPGDDWLTAVLDLIGLLLLTWPFLAPPLSTRRADHVAGIGLMAVALTCGFALWQLIRGSLGLPTTIQLTITWAHVALALAGLTWLNLPHRPTAPPNRAANSAPAHDTTRRRDRLLTVAGALLAGGSGLLIPPPTSLNPVLTAVTTTFAAAWLNWLERPRRIARPPKLEPELEPELKTDGSLFAASDMTQLLEATVAALPPTLAIRAATLLLATDERDAGDEGNAPGNDSTRLSIVARWPRTNGAATAPPFSLDSNPTLAEALTRGETVNLTHAPGAGGRHWRTLTRLLGTQPNGRATLIVPLDHHPTQGRATGALILTHDCASLEAGQLQLCRTLADQVARAAHYIQLRAHVEQQSHHLARMIRRHEQETGQLRAILESIADGVIVSDATDQVVLINDAALAILNVERSDVVGQPFGQIMAHMVPTGEIGIIGTLTETSPYSLTAVFQTSDRIVQTSMTPVENYAGVQMGVVAVLRDITALAKAEAEREQLLADLKEHGRRLEEAADKLREMDRLKSQFIANMSHELRTPLNAIIGFSSVMLKEIDGPLSDMQREDLKAINESGKHLLSLITDILDISQIWAGKMELALDEVDLPKTIADAVAIAVPLIGDKPIELTQALDPDLPAIQADEKRIRQILINLLTNAIKYTERGQVTVSASHADGHVVIGVSDTGIGIPPEYHETIFEEFSRVDSSSTRKVDGLGLGLSISRRLVELHGGQIWVKSEPDVGSTFYFTLPVDGPPQSQNHRNTSLGQKFAEGLPTEAK
ncbi:MAG: hypothetical protein DRI77_06305 [Chloroflexi bacterium]|nr:MAG: hypothetical protein DRI77_06305 [Chloroflexota bacterium]